jgi:preprotein translocase subunit SecE
LAEKKETKAVVKSTADKKSDIKKKESRKQPNAVVRYFRETIAELRKVSWPTRPEALRLTGIVLVVLAFMSLLLGSVDSLAGWALDAIIGIN